MLQANGLEKATTAILRGRRYWFEMTTSIVTGNWIYIKFLSAFGGKSSGHVKRYDEKWLPSQKCTSKTPWIIYHVFLTWYKVTLCSGSIERMPQLTWLSTQWVWVMCFLIFVFYCINTWRWFLGLAWLLRGGIRKDLYVGTWPFPKGRGGESFESRRELSIELRAKFYRRTGYSIHKNQSKKYQVKKCIVWSRETASHHCHQNSVLICATPYETNTWCVLHAIGCWRDTSACWRTSEGRVLFPSLLDRSIFDCKTNDHTSMNAF